MGASDSVPLQQQQQQQAQWPWWKRWGDEYEAFEKTRVEALDHDAFGGDATIRGSAAMEAAAEASVDDRGVTLKFLLEFTMKHNCWHMPTW